MSTQVNMSPAWHSLLQSEFEQSYFQDLIRFVKHEYATQRIYPRGRDIFRAFDSCDVAQMRVVILGQDPYHGEGQADGLCFSVPSDVAPPPSLRNIFQEIRDDVGKPIPASGDLTLWAQQGVLLLNATLTVRAHQPGSHQGRGWEVFTDAVIKMISHQKSHIVFLLWGAYAQKKSTLIDLEKHAVLSAPHPSPFSANRGFFGCKHFSKTNEYLVAHDLSPIIW